MERNWELHLNIRFCGFRSILPSEHLRCSRNTRASWPLNQINKFHVQRAYTQLGYHDDARTWWIERILLAECKNQEIGCFLQKLNCLLIFQSSPDIKPLDMPVYMTTEHGPHATQTRNSCMKLISYISGTFAIDFKFKNTWIYLKPWM